jgi:hypothetical protein
MSDQGGIHNIGALDFGLLFKRVFQQLLIGKLKKYFLR